MGCPVNKEGCEVVSKVEKKATAGDLPSGYTERCIGCLALVICQQGRVEVKPIEEQSLLERGVAGLLQMT